jgi:hypothetical protein
MRKGGTMSRLVALLVRFDAKEKVRLAREAARRTRRERSKVTQAEIVRTAVTRELDRSGD